MHFARRLIIIFQIILREYAKTNDSFQQNEYYSKGYLIKHVIFVVFFLKTPQLNYVNLSPKLS